MIKVLDKQIIVHEVCKYLKLKDMAALNIVFNMGTIIYKHLNKVKIKTNILGKLASYCKELSDVTLANEVVQHADSQDLEVLRELPIKRLTNNSLFFIDMSLYTRLEYIDSYILCLDFPEHPIKYFNTRSIYFDSSEEQCMFLSNIEQIELVIGINVYGGILGVVETDLQDCKHIERIIKKKLPLICLTTTHMVDGVKDFIREHHTLTDLTLKHNEIGSDISDLASVHLIKLRLTNIELPLTFHGSKLEHLEINNTIASSVFPNIQLPALRVLHLVEVSINLDNLYSPYIKDLTLDKCECTNNILPNFPLKRLTIIYTDKTKCIFDPRQFSRFRLLYLSICDRIHFQNSDISYFPSSLYELNLTCNVSCNVQFPPNIGKLKITSDKLTDESIVQICKLPLIKLEIGDSLLSSHATEMVQNMHIRKCKIISRI